MRLSDKVKQAILTAFNNCLSDVQFELYLFGSRTDDNKRGGDIDLLVVVGSDTVKQQIVGLKSQIRSEIFRQIPEQRIDITVATMHELSTDEFLKTVWPDCVRLTIKS